MYRCFPSIFRLQQKKRPISLYIVFFSRKYSTQYMKIN